MIECDKIKSTLSLLVTKYEDDRRDNMLTSLYSKLALLEYCGWLEETMDKIILDYIVKIDLSERIRSKIAKKIEDNHTFSYSGFMDMLMYAVGAQKTNLIEKEFETENQKLKSLLGEYHDKRNTHAHSYYIEGLPIDAPSIFSGKINQIFPILEKIYDLVVE